MDDSEIENRHNFMSMLFSILAHDLRQPFASIIMTADVLGYTQRALSNDEINLIMGDLRDVATKSIELLDGLLDWTKSQREGFEYTGQHLLLNDLVNQSNGLSKYEQQKKDITFENNIPEGQLIYAHKQMLQFIIRNILSNATKYAPYASLINVTCTEDKDGITLAINDEGNGIPPELQASLFSIHQNNQQQDAIVKSAGIALAICQDMITLMKGKLWATSVAGQGTTFYLKMPPAEISLPV